MSTTTTSSSASGTGWRVGIGLLILSLIPVTAGMLRFLQLAGGPEVVPADDRFTGFPGALVVHVGGSVLFALFGILQLVAGFRRRHRTWHRRAGRLLVVAGLAVVGSALWLTLGYAPKAETGPLLFTTRLLVAPAMGLFLVLGTLAIRRRDVMSHRAWMVRAYALGLGAGTQAFTEGITEGLVGVGELSGDLAKLAGWVINLAVAEWAIAGPGGTYPSATAVREQS